MSSTAEAGRHPGEIPNYDVVQFIRAGGFGDVWLVRERLTDARRAVKVLYKSDPQRAGRDIRGVQHYQRCAHNHPHLLQILTVGENERCFYYVMEAADEASPSTAHGYEPATLRGLIKQKGRFDARAALQLTAKLLSGAACLHRQGLAHFDLKPDNVLIIEGEPKIADVGLVAAMETGSGRSGTPAYMTPQGRADDLYAIGKMLYEFVSGQTADDFPRLSPDILQQRSAQTAAAVQLANRACHTDPARRFASVEEFSAAIEATVAEGRGARARWRTWSRMTKAAAVGALAMLGVALGISGRLIQSRFATPRLETLKRIDAAAFLSSSSFTPVASADPPRCSFLHVAGAPPLHAGQYQYDLDTPIENFVIDWHVKFLRSWGGNLELGVDDDADPLRAVRVRLGTQADGLGLCVYLIGGGERKFGPLRGHPQPGVEYVVRLARCRDQVAVGLWPLVRSCADPLLIRGPAIEKPLTVKHINLSCEADSELAKVELLDLQIQSSSRPLEDVGQPLPAAVQERMQESGDWRLVPGNFPKLSGLAPSPATNLLAGEYHPYTCGAWMPIGNWSWWDNKPDAKGKRRVRCSPFSTDERKDNPATIWYQGVQLLRFDGNVYDDFEARLHVVLRPRKKEATLSPLPCDSGEGSVGLAFRLQDQPPEGAAWGGGYCASLAFSPQEDVQDYARPVVTRFSGLLLPPDNQFAVVPLMGGETLPEDRCLPRESPMDDGAEAARQERLLKAEDGFWLTLRAEGPCFTLEIDGQVAKQFRDPKTKYFKSGRIAIYASRLIATLKSLTIKPI